jgi:cell wall assembly regulator SMI1
MTTAPRTLDEIRASYDEMLAPPDRVIPLRRPHRDDGIPSEMEILLFETPPEDRLPPAVQYTYVATAGMSLREMRGPIPSVELGICIKGNWTLDDVEPLGRWLAELAVTPFRDGTFLAPNMVLRVGSWPLFAGMTHALVTDWEVQVAKWLPLAGPPRVRLLELYALYESEAPLVRELGDLEAFRRFRREGIDPLRPDRSPALFLPAAREMENVQMTVLQKEEIDRVWEDIETWLQANAPESHQYLRPGDTDEDLDALEHETGLELPADLRASLRRHAYGKVHVYELLSAARILKSWRSKNKALADGVFAGREIEQKGGGFIQNFWWHKAWLPFARDSIGNEVCIDFNPGPDGVKGQVIFYEKETGPEPSSYMSFGAWLTGYRDDLQQGTKYVVIDGIVEHA